MRQMITLASLVLLTGCATPILQGHAALSTGRYDEAVRRFEQALAEAPEQPSALVGLGIARYKLGDLEEARRSLTQAAVQAPDSVTVQLYLALVAIRRGEDAVADAHLGRYLQLGAPARLAAQLVRTRAALLGPLTPPMRDYVVASLEDAYQWAGEVAWARQAANDVYLYWLAADVYFLPRACRCR